MKNYKESKFLYRIYRSSEQTHNKRIYKMDNLNYIEMEIWIIKYYL
jgi:hypothetical protein